MISASREGHTEAIKALLIAPDIDVNVADGNGCTALIEASNEGHAETVKLLLTVSGIDVNHASTVSLLTNSIVYIL